MQGPIQRPRRARTVRPGLPVLFVVILVAVGLAACGNSSTPTPTTVASSAAAPTPAAATDQPSATSKPAATAATGQPSATSEPAATAAPTPVPSSAPSTAAPTPVPSAAAGLDACALLTSAELSKILGAGVQVKPMPSGGWVAGQCAWNGKGSGFFLSVGTAATIAAFGDPAAADAKAKLAQFKSATSTAKDVAGIGDAAAVTATGLAATSGGTYLEITNLGLTEKQLVSLAKLVVAKL
jgi:hypothetical protein